MPISSRFAGDEDGMRFSHLRKNKIVNLSKNIMKKILFVVAVLCIGRMAEGQDRRSQQQVPTNVQRSFQRDYPQANDTRWTHNGNHWNANFTDRSPGDNGEMISHYDHKGRHLDSHIPYNRDDVPPMVRERMEKRYRNGRDYRYTRIEQYGGQPLFQVRLNIGGQQKTTYVDEQGRERSYHDGH